MTKMSENNLNFLRIQYPKVLLVRRKEHSTFSIGDEAISEFCPGLIDFLNLRNSKGDILGEVQAPEWISSVGAAGLGVYAVLSPSGKEINSWTAVTNSIEWIRPRFEEETMISIVRLEALGKTSSTVSYKVFSKEKNDLIVQGRFVLCSICSEGKRPFIQSIFDLFEKKIITENIGINNSSQHNKINSQNISQLIKQKLISSISNVVHRWKSRFKSLKWIKVPHSTFLNSEDSVEIEVVNTGFSNDLKIEIELPYGYGLDFKWECDTEFYLDFGMSKKISGKVKGLRPDGVNLGRPWTLKFILKDKEKNIVLYIITADISVSDTNPGVIYYILTEDCETFDGGEKTGDYGEMKVLGNCNNFMDPEDYRIQMIEKPDALNKIAEKYGASWTHFWTVPQKFAAQWASNQSDKGEWKKLIDDLDESIRKGSRRHEYAPHIHFDFEPDSYLPPQPRLIYDPEIDGILPNEYYDPISNKNHKYHGWDGSIKGISYVKNEGDINDVDSKTGSMRKYKRYLDRLTLGGKFNFTTRTGALDFGIKQDIEISKRSLFSNGIFADSDATSWTSPPPKGKQIYFCKPDDLQDEIEDIRDASLIQLRCPEVQINSNTLEELNAWFEKHNKAYVGRPGIHAIVGMTHAMFMKGYPDEYRDLRGGDFEKLDRHLDNVKKNYPDVKFGTASEVIIEFLDYYTPTAKAVITNPRSISTNFDTLIYPIRILGKGIPISQENPIKLTVQAPAFLDPDEIISLTVMEKGVPVANSKPGKDRIPELEFIAIDHNGYDLDIKISPDIKYSFNIENNVGIISLPAISFSISNSHQFIDWPESDAPDIFKLRKPHLIRKKVADEHKHTEGDIYEWHIPSDLFQILINPIGGSKELIGRRFHPYGRFTEGAGIYSGLQILGNSYMPKKLEIRYLKYLSGKFDFRTLCILKEVADDYVTMTCSFYEEVSEMAKMEIMFIKKD